MIYETSVSDKEYAELEDNYLVLSARQEKDGMTVRFYSKDRPEIDAEEKTPDLEDVFLVTYR